MNQRGMNSSGIPYQVYEPERYEQLLIPLVHRPVRGYLNYSYLFGS
jgi:hypothetical protein